MGFKPTSFLQTELIINGLMISTANRWHIYSAFKILYPFPEVLAWLLHRNQFGFLPCQLKPDWPLIPPFKTFVQNSEAEQQCLSNSEEVGNIRLSSLTLKLLYDSFLIFGTFVTSSGWHARKNKNKRGMRKNSSTGTETIYYLILVGLPTFKKLHITHTTHCPLV